MTPRGIILSTADPPGWKTETEWVPYLSWQRSLCYSAFLITWYRVQDCGPPPSLHCCCPHSAKLSSKNSAHFEQT